mmetsp:Transcript_10118/g.22759  ORF Transcript_10118/g.22759 Transcript_10118/m.22759 type:complete len:285 (-) Transcript_10118:245-1099(-)
MQWCIIRHQEFASKGREIASDIHISRPAHAFHLPVVAVSAPVPQVLLEHSAPSGQCLCGPRSQMQALIVLKLRSKTLLHTNRLPSESLLQPMAGEAMPCYHSQQTVRHLQSVHTALPPYVLTNQPQPVQLAEHRNMAQECCCITRLSCPQPLPKCRASVLERHALARQGHEHIGDSPRLQDLHTNSFADGSNFKLQELRCQCRDLKVVCQQEQVHHQLHRNSVLHAIHPPQKPLPSSLAANRRRPHCILGVSIHRCKLRSQDVTTGSKNQAVSRDAGASWKGHS